MTVTAVPLGDAGTAPADDVPGGASSGTDASGGASSGRSWQFAHDSSWKSTSPERASTIFTGVGVPTSARAPRSRAW